jgi:apolipoprotein N-acyltransferase
VCCVLILLAFFTPRIVLFVLWLFTDYLNRAFDGFVLPLLGFLFLPATTLAYAIAQNELGGLNGLGIIVVLIGLAVDIGLLGGGASRRRG